MSITPLNIGSAPNDGNGQDLRSGGQVINDNFAELDTRTNAAQATADAAVTEAALQEGLDAKVDKIAGKGLSTEDFTTGEKNKLAGLQPAHYRGTFITLAALQAGVVTPTAGDYGDVDAGVGSDVQRYIWDATDTKWVLQGASGGGPDNTDSLPEGSTNLYFTGARVLAVALSGLSLLTGTAVVATDSVLVAIGKLQKQITDLAAAVANKASKGANSDITSLGGLTTPLSKAQGGTGSAAGIPVMVGATAAVSGVAGLAPAGAAGDQDKFLTAGGVYKEAGGAGLPVGSIVPWPVSRATLPAGWIARDGQLLNRADWPDLWALVSASAVTDAVWLASPYASRGKYSTGDGSTTFRMPDTNAKHADGNTIAAMFLRGDGKNSAGTVGLHAADQLQDHQHVGTGAGGTAAGNPAPTSSDVFGVSAGTNAGTSYAYATNVTNFYRGLISGVYTGTSVGSTVPTPRTGNETRPPAETVIWCTAGAGKATNPGSVDVTALATSVSTQASQIATLDAALAFTYVYPNGGTEAAPASVSVNTRYSLSNPYPGKQVILRAQIQVAGVWEETGWLAAPSSASDTYGCKATLQGTDSIVVQTGGAGLAVGGNYDGGSRARGTATISTACPCRVAVWRVKG